MGSCGEVEGPGRGNPVAGSVGRVNRLVRWAQDPVNLEKVASWRETSVC